MNRHTHTPLTLVFLSLLLGASSARAQDTSPPQDEDEDSGDQARQYKEVIDETVRENDHFIRWCYVLALEDDPTIMGMLTVEFVIDADGSVGSAETISSTLDDDGMESCVSERIRRLRFPEPVGGDSVKVAYPFAFATTTPPAPGESVKKRWTKRKRGKRGKRAVSHP